MMSRLNNNYLVLEVWSNGSLLGISKLNTTPIHSAFKTGFNPFQTGSEQLDFYNEDIDVVDLFQNKVQSLLNKRHDLSTSDYAMLWDIKDL